MKDRGFVESLIERARLAGCDGLVLTLDLQRLGQRHKDIRNGLTAPPDLTLNNLLSSLQSHLGVSINYQLIEDLWQYCWFCSWCFKSK